MDYCIEREAFAWQTKHFYLKSETIALTMLVSFAWIVYVSIWFQSILKRWFQEMNEMVSRNDCMCPCFKNVKDTCSHKTFGNGAYESGIGQRAHMPLETLLLPLPAPA